MSEEESALQRELRETGELADWARDQLYMVRAGGWRAEATTAVAAAAAEETFRLSDRLPKYQNATSVEWRGHLDKVWRFLAGDRAQHYALSAAIADFLVGPLNHIEGQDGPDDFDRPQTIASYSAALAAITWGVDFATTAVSQIFECIDLEFDGEHPPEREAEVTRKILRVREVVGLIVDAAKQDARLTPEVLATLRG